MILNGKLYDLIRNVELPQYSTYTSATDTYTSVSETLPATFAVHWPNGSPCVPVEMYLLDLQGALTVRSVDGGSLKVTVAHLTHLIRYCWHIQKDFNELYDDDFHTFAHGLHATSPNHTRYERRRNNNTVRAIIDTTIAFLRWLQNNFYVGLVIVGERHESPQIRLVRKRYRGRYGDSRDKLIYALQPATDTPDPKGPMPREVRNRLWDAVAAMAQPEHFARSYVARFESEQAFHDELDYLRSRRELLLILLEATGCRPEELSRLRVSPNSGCANSGKIKLPTVKRRKKRDPIRSIPVEGSVCIKLELFIEIHRAKMLRKLHARGKKTNPDDYVFLCSRKGTPVPALTLAKEFQRITRKAGIQQRSCMSMFRHRFITNMVRLHLSEFLRKRPETSRAMITESDYRTILRKVAVFTGHGSAQSLMHYIDWAWDEMGVFDYVQPAAELCYLVESTVGRLSMLASEIRLKRGLRRADVVDRVLSELTALRDRTKTAIEGCKNSASSTLP